jgi:DNA-binding GntR family transcriptional regulator
MKAGFARVDEEMKAGFGEVREEMHRLNDRGDRFNDRFDRLNDRFDRLLHALMVMGVGFGGTVLAAVIGLRVFGL